MSEGQTTTRIVDPFKASIEFAVTVAPSDDPDSTEPKITVTSPQLEVLNPDLASYFKRAFVEPRVGTLRFRHSVDCGMELIDAGAYDAPQAMRFIGAFSRISMELLKHFADLCETLPTTEEITVAAERAVHIALDYMLDHRSESLPRRGFIQVIPANPETFRPKTTNPTLADLGLAAYDDTVGARVEVRIRRTPVPCHTISPLAGMIITDVNEGKVTIAVAANRHSTTCIFAQYFNNLLADKLRCAIGDIERDAVATFREELHADIQARTAFATHLDAAFELPTYTIDENEKD